MELGSTVTLTYEGRTEDGEVFGYASEEKPMVFQTGMDMTIDGFEKAILEMNEVGEKKTFTVDMYDGYGEYLEDYTQVIPKSQIPARNEIKPGKRIWLASSDDGAPIPATIIKVEGEDVTFDLNHPLAGKNLVYDVEILAIEEPPEDFVSAAEKARHLKQQSKLLGGDQANDFR